MTENGGVGRPIRIVLAEDHVLVREGLRRALQDAGDIAVVGEASDGVEAVRVARELEPDLVLMDISMPRMTGIEATVEIKRLLPRTAVLVLTAYDEEEYVVSMLEAGAGGYLLKTASSLELVHAVRAVCAGEAVLDAEVTRRFLAGLRPGARQAQHVPAITEQEQAILRLAARGLTNKAIGHELSLSPRTVQDHFERIFGKLGVGSRTEAVAKALVVRLITLEDDPG